MCVSISSTVALVCLFGPKVYIVIFQPHKNVRQGATPSLSTASRSFPKPFIPPSSPTEPAVNFTSNNGSVRTSHFPNSIQTHGVIETVNDMFSDSLEEDEDEFCDDSSFIPKPTEDKATSTNESWINLLCTQFNFSRIMKHLYYVFNIKSSRLPRSEFQNHFSYILYMITH